MGEPLGLLKVIIVRGKKLAVRDFKTSDPYVVVKLGNQTAKTRVINSNLNPVWNEELSFSLKDSVGALTFTAKTRVINSNLNPVWNEELSFSLKDSVGALTFDVFDKDLLKVDDKMGHAHLSLQPLISAARLRQILRVSSGETSLRKVTPENENCLATESTISCINGEVVQDVLLRLCDVESGEIELKLKLTSSSSSAA